HRQVYGYGMGVTAFYTKMVLEDPRRLGTLMRLLPRAVSDLLLQSSAPEPSPEMTVPGIRSARFQGMAAGPRAYLRSRSEQRRVAAGR
ncbi:MAG: hypothetical protein ABI746_11890, partial [Dermatophilaceae bacterium]